MSRDWAYDGREQGLTDQVHRVSPAPARFTGSEKTRNAAFPDFDLSDLRARIDRAAENSPALDDFLERLEREGVRPIPSLQSNGRWNGISYEFAGVRVKGSELGRAYTATGLQRKKRVRYDPARDLARLRCLAETSRTPERSLEQRGRQAREMIGSRIDSRQQQVLWDAGRFRTLAVSDVAREHYAGDYGKLQHDLKTLARLGFIERHTVSLARRRTLSVITLTKDGKKLLRTSNNRETLPVQAIYSGVVKPRELAHDAAIYRMYLTEARRIASERGRVQRVMLDYELKKRAYAPLAKARDLPPLEYAECQQEIAAENDLPVIEGHIAIPDLRLEYETADGDARHIDLELVTRNYRGAHLRVKAAAGFKMYAAPGATGYGVTDSGPLRPVFDDHNLVAELLRL
jgi:hypothetical protein